MLRALIRKEVVLHVLSLRFGVTFILFILLVFVSIYVTTNEYQLDTSQYAACERGAADHLAEVLKEEEGRRRMRRLFDWEGRMDAVPVPLLSSVAQGLRPFTPIAVNTTAEHSRNIGKGLATNPLTGLHRFPDIVYVVSVVLSLLAILFVFDSVCGEKESGTLRLMMSNSVPRDSILLAKWLGGYVVLIVPFLVAATGGLGYVWWRGSLELNGENLQRLAAMLLVACLYISVFFTLSLFVSTVTRRAVTALFVCLLVWVMWVLVIPNLAPVVAKITSPTPSVEKINAEKRAVDEETRLRIDRLVLTTGELWYGQRIEQEREKLEQEGRARKKRWDRFLEKKKKRQTDVAETLGRLSPSVCWTYAAVALTDSGPEAYRRLEKAQERLSRDMGDFESRLGEERRKSDEWPTIAAEQVPRLQVVWPDLGQAVRSALNDLLILAILNAVLFMLAFIRFLRYDVT